MYCLNLLAIKLRMFFHVIRVFLLDLYIQLYIICTATTDLLVITGNACNFVAF